MMVWDTHICPRCGAEVAIKIMSLAATCGCGMFYAAVAKNGGWHESAEAYYNGGAPCCS